MPLAVNEEVDLHGVAGDPRPLIRAASGVDAMTVGGAAAGSRFSHLGLALTGGFLTGFNAAALVTVPVTFEDDAFSLTALFGTPDRGRALLVDLPPGTTAPVVLRGGTVTADSALHGQDGAGLIETAHGTLQVRDLIVSNVAEGADAIAGLSAASDAPAADAILDVDGATINVRGRCLGLFGGSGSACSTLRNLTVTQDVPGGGQASVECVRIGSSGTTIDGMTVTAQDTSGSATQYDDSAIEAWQALNLTLRRTAIAGNVLTNDPTPAFALSSAGEPGATFECALDAAPWTDCPASYVAPALADGGHTLAARARDAAGNPDPTPATFAFTVDTRPPVTQSGGGAPTPAPTGGAPSIPPDRTAPKLVLTISKPRLRAALSKGVKVRVRSDEAAAGTIAATIPVATVRKLKLGRKAITFARATASIAGTASFRLKQRSALRRKLARRRKLTLRLVVKVKDAAGNATTVARTLKLKR